MDKIEEILRDKTHHIFAPKWYRDVADKIRYKSNEIVTIDEEYLELILFFEKNIKLQRKIIKFELYDKVILIEKYKYISKKKLNLIIKAWAHENGYKYKDLFVNGARAFILSKKLN